jgi:hypothetical protein
LGAHAASSGECVATGGSSRQISSEDDAPCKLAKGAKGAAAELTPIVGSDVAHAVTDNEGNFVERRGLKIGLLDAKEPLGYMYDYWRWLRNVTPCQLSNVDTVHLMRAGIVGALHVIDVESSDPEDFRFELAGYRITLERCENPRHLSYAIYGDSVLRDYNTVRLTAVPKLQGVRSQLGAMHYNYTRLILPLFDARRRVSRLPIAVRREPGDATILKP